MSESSADRNKFDSVVPKRPSMDAGGFEAFSSRITNSLCYLEYGSGGSTRQACAKGVKKVYSVESDPDFAREVRRAVSWRNRSETFKIVVPDIGPTKAWGYPVDSSASTRWKNYVTDIWRKLEAAGDSPDLVLIDGRFRVACFAYCLLMARPGTIILFDDFCDRQDKYSAAAKLLEPRAMHGRMAEFEVPEVLASAKEVGLVLFEYGFDPR